MHPAPQGADKKYGALSLSLCLSHAHTHTHSHTVDTRTCFLSLHLCLFSPPHYIFNYQVRRETHYFLEVGAHAGVSFWHNTRGEQTKSICWDLDLLIPLANCENNHLKMTLRQIWFIYFHFSGSRDWIHQMIYLFFFFFRCVLKELGSNYWRVISLFDTAFLIDSRAFHANHDQGWAARDPPQGLYLISLLAPVWLA